MTRPRQTREARTGGSGTRQADAAGDLLTNLDAYPGEDASANAACVTGSVTFLIQTAPTSDAGFCGYSSFPVTER